MFRIGLLARLLLILLSSLVALGAASLFLLRWQDAHRTPRPPAPFLRVRQTAAIADLLAGSAPSVWDRAPGAVGSTALRVSIVDRAPAIGDLIAAPRLEAKLHGFGRSPVAAGMRVYTNRREQGRNPADGVEGFMARAVGPLPDGRFLVVDAVVAPRSPAGTPFGLPYGVWIGLFGAALAALAVYGTARETRPVQALARALDGFDGVAPNILPEPQGASDLRDLTFAVNAMQRRVAALVRERTLMIGTISHDLRTLLTRLQLRVVSLPEDESRARLVSDLETMRDLLEDALAFARGTDVGLVRGVIDLSDLVASEVAEQEAVGAPLPIETDLDDAPVVGDPTGLRRVVANLVDNGLKFGRSRVAIRVWRAGDAVRLSVADDGPGVPAAERGLVLVPFHRLENARDEPGGVGLGLAIAYQIVVAHGGSLHVQTSELGGADIQVSLPRA